jgi:hypothetical protein
MQMYWRTGEYRSWVLENWVLEKARKLSPVPAGSFWSRILDHGPVGCLLSVPQPPSYMYRQESDEGEH